MKKFGRKLPPELHALQIEIEGYARDYGLDFFPQIFEVLDYDQINQIAAYGGFPVRYPHWRFGMEYEQLSKSYEYGLSKIYEMVINNNPCYAYLMESNALVDQKIVIAHVLGHNDFFKNNEYFRHTNRSMMNEMANHAVRVRRYIDRYGQEEVENFIDVCLTLDNLIDYHSSYFEDMDLTSKEEDTQLEEIPKLHYEREYMSSYINPEDYLEEQRRRIEEKRNKEKTFPASPVKDVLYFLMKHAPLSSWQRDVLGIIREEAYYYAPQGQTKILNEGWACVDPDTLIFTDAGLIPMSDVVAGKAQCVSDGTKTQNIYDQHIIRNHDTITVETRRGLRLCGSNNHRVLLEDHETWKRLDELEMGDSIAISGGVDLWPQEEVPLSWSSSHRVNLTDEAEEVGVSLWTGFPHRSGRNTRQSTAVAAALEVYDSPEAQALPQSVSRRQPIQIPTTVNEQFGAFLGYLLGNGHISRVKRRLGLTSGDKEQALHFLKLVQDLFGVMASIQLDGNHWRVLAPAEMLSDMLQQELGLCDGSSATHKEIPAQVLRSPEPVVRAFLRACFDCNGYADDHGVILSTKSNKLAEQTQLLLMNYGILSCRSKQADGCYHVHITGSSAKVYSERIGFGLQRKQEKLDAYVSAGQGFKAESWTDEIVSITEGKGDVYDISVEDTHRYVGAGLINHNSYWHSKIMTEKAANDGDIIDFARSHAGVVATQRDRLNPYKLGIELLRDIEERWNKGRFGKEYDECDDMYEKNNWDKQLGLGREKIFQVRRIYNDVNFIDEFLTEEFCIEHKMFGFDYNDRNQRFEISTRNFKDVKEKLLSQLTNFGQPYIQVLDGNFENRAELLLYHRHEGIDLNLDYARSVLENLHVLWKRPVQLCTKVNDKGRLVIFNGTDHSVREFTYPEEI